MVAGVPMTMMSAAFAGSSRTGSAARVMLSGWSTAAGPATKNVRVAGAVGDASRGTSNVSVTGKPAAEAPGERARHFVNRAGRAAEPGDLEARVLVRVGEQEGVPRSGKQSAVADD